MNFVSLDKIQRVMKTKLPFIVFLALTVILMSGFMVREKEDSTNSSEVYNLFQGDKCFASFISNLQKMEALIFIPKDKMGEAQSLDLSLVSADRARILNKNIAEERNFYVQVYPSGNPRDECSRAVSLNFKNLGMVCFVRKERTDELKNQLQFKFEPGTLYFKFETAKILASKPEELQFKFNTTNAAWKNYVAVK
jgi:hypothetical protein